MDDSPRATKRRKVNGESTPQKSSRISTPKTYSKKQKLAKGRDSDKENDKSAQAEEVTVEPGFVDSAFDLPPNYDPQLLTQSDRMRATPSTTGFGEDLEVLGQQREVATHSEFAAASGMQEEESAESDTVEVAPPSSARTSGRQRKQTWKLVPAAQSKPSPKSRRKAAAATSTPSSKAKKIAESSAETPSQEHLTTPASLAEAALQVVSGSAETPTPTPTKQKRQRKNITSSTKKAVLVAKTTPALAPETTHFSNDIPGVDVIDPALLEHGNDAEKAPLSSALAAIPDDDLIDASPFKTVAPNLTPTPRKRGRPPKARIVDEFGFTAVDPTGGSAKRRKANLAEDAEDIDPVAAFVRRDPASVAKASMRQDLVTKAKSVTWKDYKHDSLSSEQQPSIEDSFDYLENLLQDDAFSEPFGQLKANVLSALTGKIKIPLKGLDDEYQKVHQIVHQTVVAGEGNSMLVIGPRGCGKSALVESVVRDVSNEFQNDFHTIRLDGFIHTDDKLALREIWRQLGREMDLEDGMLERSNYADTLASLLAVLSHPTEQDNANKMEENQAAKSIVFIIDEFDLFTSHARQTLLYNLFDVAQARKAPIAVLGLTTRVDVTECLEKRVKSRFSHRSVFLPRPKSFLAFQQICLSALKAENHTTDLSVDETLYQTLQAAWSDYLTSLFHDSTSLTAMLRSIYATSRSIPMAFASLTLPIGSMSATTIPNDATFTSQSLLPPDSKLTILQSLNDLELVLLIATARLDIILNVDTCNFNMAYDEYTQLANRTKIQTSASGALAVGAGSRIWSREAALGAWEKLEIWELIMPLATAGYGAGSGLADVGRAGKLVRCDVSLEEIRYSGVEMSGTMMKWCKEI